MAMAGNKQERTFVLIKPDGVQRGLVPQIMQEFQVKGFRLVGMKLKRADEKLLEEMYPTQKDLPYFLSLVREWQPIMVAAMVWEGPDAIQSIKKLIGRTNPIKADPRTLRGRFGIYLEWNTIHGSGSVEEAAREIGLWFTPVELDPVGTAQFNDSMVH